jgi:lactoylglutathione lyase
MENLMPDQALEIMELNHVALYVRDLAASERFYGEVLGLPILKRPAFGFPGAWFALGTQELHLIVDTEHVNDERHSVHFALRVADARAGHELLLERGVEIVSGPSPRPDGAIQVFFNDPDGYLIEITSF